MLSSKGPKKTTRLNRVAQMEANKSLSSLGLKDCILLLFRLFSLGTGSHLSRHAGTAQVMGVASIKLRLKAKEVSMEMVGNFLLSLSSPSSNIKGPLGIVLLDSLAVTHRILTCKVSLTYLLKFWIFIGVQSSIYSGWVVKLSSFIRTGLCLYESYTLKNAHKW